MPHRFIGLGAFNAFIAVAAGAFAAHGLKNTISSSDLVIFKTAVNYQMVHALGLILIGILINNGNNNQNRKQTLAGWFMLTGIIIFSGSLYVLSLTGMRWLGMVTPIGGICFLVAWLLLSVQYLFE